jgi:thiol-disulfide isomerase/thioredoxin
MRHRWVFAAVILATSLAAQSLRGDEAKEDEPKKPAKPAAEKPADDENPASDLYTLPKGSDVKAIMKFVQEIQDFEPTSVEQARTHQRKGRLAIGDAARAILKIEKDTKSEAYLFAKSYELGSELRSLIAASPEDRQAYCDQVTLLLQNPHAGGQQLMLAMKVAELLEDIDRPLAIDAYKKFGAALAKSPDEKIAKNGKMLAGAARRLDLPGNALKLTGNKFDGAKFDLADLKGKVVLVDFWATWCGPCIAEIPNMKKMYKKYHDQGFEIVGLSIDEDRDALQEFLEDRQLPWTILHDKENEGQHPATVDYGVFGIPCMILVGKDGKVIDIQARGERLEELLEKQFAVEEPSPPAGKNGADK